MAKRLTDRQQKKIIADFVESGNYSAVARKNKVNPSTVKRLVDKHPEMQRKAEDKKRKNTEDILAHMEKKKDVVNQIIDRYLAALLEEGRIEKATPSQITTAIGTLIDKFTANAGKDTEITINHAIPRKGEQNDD